MAAATGQLRRVLITGANKGIGWHMAQQLVTENDDIFVYVGSRSIENGNAAVAKIVEANPAVADRITSVSIDITNKDSVEAARDVISGQGGLWALVNNGGIAEGGYERVINVNSFGTKMTTDIMLPLVEDGGRIVFTSSAAGPYFLSSCEEDVQRKYIDADNFSWGDVNQLLTQSIDAFNEGGEDQLNAYLASQGINSKTPAYGISKFAVNCYCMQLAKEMPNLLISAYTPGYLATALVASMAEKQGKTLAEMGAKPPREGTASMKHCLFADLDGSGYYYGSDSVRSPLHIYRGPGDSPYTGGFEWTATMEETFVAANED